MTDTAELVGGMREGLADRLLCRSGGGNRAQNSAVTCARRLRHLERPKVDGADRIRLRGRRRRRPYHDEPAGAGQSHRRALRRRIRLARDRMLGAPGRARGADRRQGPLLQRRRRPQRADAQPRGPRALRLRRDVQPAHGHLALRAARTHRSSRRCTAWRRAARSRSSPAPISRSPRRTPNSTPPSPASASSATAAAPISCRAGWVRAARRSSTCSTRR